MQSMFGKENVGDLSIYTEGIQGKPKKFADKFLWIDYQPPSFYHQSFYYNEIIGDLHADSPKFPHHFIQQ